MLSSYNCRIATILLRVEMTWMMKAALGAVSLAAIVTQANAADLAARPYTKAPPMVAAVYDWSGFYIGINGGGGSAPSCRGQLVPAGVLSQGCHNSTGGTVGGQIGYRWQASNWVFGLEGQGNWADFSGSNLAPGGAKQRIGAHPCEVAAGEVGPVGPACP